MYKDERITKLELALRAIMNGARLDRDDFERERIHTTLVHTLDTIYTIAYEALEENTNV